tara:strand:+ start:412 stop:558 length:147 start_codon:yes stop_codon:yes gene_type:complete
VKYLHHLEIVIPIAVVPVVSIQVVAVVVANTMRIPILRNVEVVVVVRV